MKKLALSLLFAAAALPQQPAPVILTVDIDNAVQYRSDIADPAKRGTDGGSTTAAAPRAFTDVLYIGDIVAINGKPAKGLWTSRQLIMNFSPAPAVGFGIADVTRGTLADCKWEFLDSDGRFVGALADSGLAPHAVVGGAGAFYGAQGQMAGATSPNPKAIRVASMSEDPANRRINGGGTNRVVFHIMPLYRPRIEAVWHADFSPVTATDPVRPGETVVLRATGLGPLVPGTTPPGADPFPANPAEVNSPVEVAINGRAGAVINKIGWPLETNVYRVDVRVPDDLPSGKGILQITAAWIPGDPYTLPAR